jgi:hypothetical protein
LDDARPPQAPKKPTNDVERKNRDGGTTRCDDSDLFGGLFFGVDLPVGKGLRPWADIGNIGVDPLGRSGATRCVLGAIREARGLIVALGYAGLLPLALIGSWS